MKTFALTILIAVSSVPGFAQTGPGGVGNATDNVLWLDAGLNVFSDAGTTLALNTNNVQQWNDRSGNGRNAIQTTVGNRPNYSTGVVNGNPVIRYTSANSDRLTSTGVSTGNTASVWAVASYSSLPQPNPGIIQASPSGLSGSTGAADKAIGLWVSSGAGTRVWGRGVQSNNTQQNISQVTTLNANTFYIINSVYRTNRIDQYVNHDAAGNNTAHNGTLRSWTDVSIGQQGSESWNGDFAEFIFYNTEVNTAQRIIIDNYLAAKYALTLGSNDLYVHDNPANGNFDFEVAGIGRISGSDLHNDAQGTGILRIRNPSGLNNGEFLIWGHNNGVQQAIETADVPVTVQARFDRVWRVSEVNTSGTAVDVGAIDIRFDLAALVPVTASDLRLIVDTDNDGIFSDETPIAGATSIGGNVYEFSAVTAITNNLRFTLGTINSFQTPLPIELVSFDAINVDHRFVQLDWQTASEINNDFFTIERSADVVEWHEVIKVRGAGNSSTVLNYTTYDEDPLPGLAYYRLKQTDFNGAYTYSHIRSINILESESSKLTIYPNPSSSEVVVTGNEFELEQMGLYNSYGQDVTAQSTITRRSDREIIIDLTQLNDGIYLVKTLKTSGLVLKQ